MQCIRFRSRTAVTAVTTGLLATALLAANAPANAAPRPRPATGMVSLTFDDGKVAQIKNTTPILERNGMRGTYYVIARAMRDWGLKTYLSPAQVKALAARGHEVGNHSSQHYNLVEVQAGKKKEYKNAKADLADAQKIFKATTGLVPKTCAYPFGKADEGVQKGAQEAGLKGCRATHEKVNKPGSLRNYDLGTVYITRKTTVAEVKAAAESAKRNGTWVIFVWHGVNEKLPPKPENEDILTSTFAAQVAAIKKTGVTVRTVDQAFTAYGRR
jgi:peptidoglycan/xylan/chitin deacetylase (PgdA/CDA1 family)